jgi:hypothetical protein
MRPVHRLPQVPSRRFADGERDREAREEENDIDPVLAAARR